MDFAFSICIYTWNIIECLDVLIVLMPKMTECAKRRKLQTTDFSSVFSTFAEKITVHFLFFKPKSYRPKKVGLKGLIVFEVCKRRTIYSGFVALTTANSEITLI